MWRGSNALAALPLLACGCISVAFGNRTTPTGAERVGAVTRAVATLRPLAVRVEATSDTVELDFDVTTGPFCAHEVEVDGSLPT